jgi:hypothetical protein
MSATLQARKAVILKLRLTRYCFPQSGLQNVVTCCNLLLLFTPDGIECVVSLSVVTALSATFRLDKSYWTLQNSHKSLQTS